MNDRDEGGAVFGDGDGVLEFVFEEVAEFLGGGGGLGLSASFVERERGCGGRGWGGEFIGGAAPAAEGSAGAEGTAGGGGGF